MTGSAYHAKKTIPGCGILLLAGALCLFLPLMARAHEQRLLEIKGKEYLLFIGFSPEPAFVNDRTSVALFVFEVPPGSVSGPVNRFPEGAQYVFDLNITNLQVEVASGDQKRIFEFKGIFPPSTTSYKADFFPTADDVYSFRIFGRLNGVLVDFTTSCTPLPTHSEISRAHPLSAVRTEISPGVVMKLRNVGFPCPISPSTAEFPERGVLPSTTSPTGAREPWSVPPIPWAAVYRGLGGVAALAILAGVILGLRALIRRRGGVPPY